MDVRFSCHNCSQHIVDYGDNIRPTFTWKEFLDPVNESQIRVRMNDFYKRKSGSWEYEDEYRLVFDYARCRSDPDACVSSGGRYFWDIPDDFVTRIIIGFRSSLSELYVRKALKQHDCFRNTRLAKATLSVKDYKVKVEDMTS